jgi:aryl-alcohol dehydrogenase-like predicted oxidoreductase
VRFSPLQTTGSSVSRLTFAATTFTVDDHDLASLHKVDAALADSLVGRAVDVGINFPDAASFYAGRVSVRARRA